jgi:hypothetical protein
MDFKLFRVGDKQVVGSSFYSTGLSRSATLRVELPAGDYVVHVSSFLAGSLSYCSRRFQVRLDRKIDKAQATLISENMTSWDDKKMSKVWSQVAQSKSIAANFDSK